LVWAARGADRATIPERSVMDRSTEDLQWS